MVTDFVTSWRELLLAHPLLALLTFLLLPLLLSIFSFATSFASSHISSALGYCFYWFLPTQLTLNKVSFPLSYTFRCRSCCCYCRQLLTIDCRGVFSYVIVTVSSLLLVSLFLLHFHRWQTAMVREQVNSDDDLTNLNWLQAGNILDMIPCDLTNNEKSRASCNKRITIARDKLTSRSIIVPPVAYDPLIHIRTRPPFSFSCLIFMAIESSPDKVLPVRCIYSWITHHFPFYRYEKLAWKNTVRHKLSRSKCFKRLDRHSRKPVSIDCLIYFFFSFFFQFTCLLLSSMCSLVKQLSWIPVT